jgi:hypothetical protein
MCNFKTGKRILRYLNVISEYRLNVIKTIEGPNLHFEVYTDADWASESDDRKSVNAAMTFMNGMIISWMCDKLSLVALSAMESEFVSAARGIQEAMDATLR